MRTSLYGFVGDLEGIPVIALVSKNSRSVDSLFDDADVVEVAWISSCLCPQNNIMPRTTSVSFTDPNYELYSIWNNGSCYVDLSKLLLLLFIRFDRIEGGRPIWSEELGTREAVYYCDAYQSGPACKSTLIILEIYLQRIPIRTSSYLFRNWWTIIHRRLIHMSI